MPIRFTIYPDLCDAYGHLNQAAYLSLFERARWELLARGPGIDVFERAEVWPAVRHAAVDYHAGAWPGDVLEFTTDLVRRGRTSFTLRQHAVRLHDRQLVATLEAVFVCIDRHEQPVAVPELVVAWLGRVPMRAALPGGMTIAWEEAGEGAPPVLFVHGYPLDRALWAAQLEGLHRHRLLAPDLRGFGDSATSNPPALSIDQHADDLANFLDRLEIGRAVVVGLSMGGYVALAMAERHRDRLAGLVLVDTRAGADDAAGRAGRDATIATINGGGGRDVVRGLAPRLFTADTPASVRDPVVARMEAIPPEGLVAALGAMRDRPDRSDLLPTLAGLPTLVLVGSDDRITPPAEARAMAGAIPGAELVVVEGAGHLTPVERPEAVNDALQRFLDTRV